MSKLTAIDIKKIKAAVLSVFPECDLAFIFGSFAKGENKKASDLDIAILLNSKIAPLIRFEKAQQLSRILGEEVDLIDLLDTSDYLKFQIVNDGIVIIGSPIVKQVFETRAYRDYQDTKQRNSEIEKQIINNLFDKGAA